MKKNAQYLSEIDQSHGGVIGDIAAIIGQPAADAISKNFGGIEIYIPNPEAINDNHPLAIAVGMELARTLARDLGRGKLNIPQGIHSNANQTKQKILHLNKMGLSAPKIARQLGITERWVRYRLAELKLDQAQGDLFL